MGVSPLIEHHEMDPFILEMELESAWHAARLHDNEMERVRRELKMLQRRHARLLSAFRPLRKAVAQNEVGSEIANVAIESVRAYNAALYQGE